MAERAQQRQGAGGGGGSAASDNRAETIVIVADVRSRSLTPAWIARSDCYSVAFQPVLDWDKASSAGVILVVLENERAVPADRIRRTADQEDAPPILVCGPASPAGWRAIALQAGALACFSDATAVEDQQSLFAAAARCHAAQREIVSLRAEANRICDSLLRNYGGAAEQLLHARGEADRIREDLEEMRTRILRAFT